MHPTRLIAALTALLCASAAGRASAEIRVYDSVRELGSGGDDILNNTDGQGTVEIKPNETSGRYAIRDVGSGTVTLEELTHVVDGTIDLDLTLLGGPSSFVFIGTGTSLRPAAGQTGSGSAAQGSGTISWGILGGWSATGSLFCLGSPISFCNDNGFAHGVTLAAKAPSATYDLGTWSFDAVGDFESPPYILQTFSGGLANQMRTLRGTFRGSSLPALPLAGFGALATGLVLAGLRAARRHR